MKCPEHKGTPVGRRRRDCLCMHVVGVRKNCCSMPVDERRQGYGRASVGTRIQWQCAPPTGILVVRPLVGGDSARDVHLLSEGALTTRPLIGGARATIIHPLIRGDKAAVPVTILTSPVTAVAVAAVPFKAVSCHPCVIVLRVRLICVPLCACFPALLPSHQSPCSHSPAFLKLWFHSYVSVSMAICSCP